MLKTIGKIGIAALVGILLRNLLFGGNGDKNMEILTLVKAGALIVDTRTPDEFANGHVQGAVNIPYDVIANSIDQHETDLSKPIIVYCRSGSRSSHAKRYLTEAGYTNTVNAGSMKHLLKALKE